LQSLPILQVAVQAALKSRNAFAADGFSVDPQVLVNTLHEFRVILPVAERTVAHADRAAICLSGRPDSAINRAANSRFGVHFQTSSPVLVLCTIDPILLHLIE
jgi:hypothetical protein